MNFNSDILFKKAQKGFRSLLVVLVCLNLFAAFALNGICGCGEGCTHCELLAIKHVKETKAMAHASQCCSVPAYDDTALTTDSGKCRSIDISTQLTINAEPQTHNISVVAGLTLNQPASGHFEEEAILSNFLTPTTRTSPIYLLTLSFLC